MESAQGSTLRGTCIRDGTARFLYCRNPSGAGRLGLGGLVSKTMPSSLFKTANSVGMPFLRAVPYIQRTAGGLVSDKGRRVHRTHRTIAEGHTLIRRMGSIPRLSIRLAPKSGPAPGGDGPRGRNAPTSLARRRGRRRPSPDCLTRFAGIRARRPAHYLHDLLGTGSSRPIAALTKGHPGHILVYIRMKVVGADANGTATSRR